MNIYTTLKNIILWLFKIYDGDIFYISIKLSVLAQSDHHHWLENANAILKWVLDHSHDKFYGPKSETTVFIFKLCFIAKSDSSDPCIHYTTHRVTLIRTSCVIVSESKTFSKSNEHLIGSVTFCSDKSICI